VETIVCSPGLTSHRHLSPEAKRKEGINDNLLRLSAGIEDADDLLMDIEQALS
jgi:cystathionine beta-lyase/cystathionine gamma-synthase